MMSPICSQSVTTIALTVWKLKKGPKIFKPDIAQKLTRTPLYLFFVPFDDNSQYLENTKV
jgi:hypothetical protein